MYRVVLKTRAERQFAKLPQSMQQRCYAAFQALSQDPFVLPHLKKLSQTENGYRLRIGRWRILFTLFVREKRIEVIDIFLKKGSSDYAKRRDLL